MKWERREAKLTSKRNRMKKHGGGLMRIYVDAVTKAKKILISR